MNRPRHRHECGCGDFFVCSQPADQCDIRNWDCPNCAMRALDAYVEQMLNPQEHEQEPQQEQEHAHER